MAKQGILLVVSGPSGAGKGTVCDALLKEYKGLEYSISMTTRAPREGETDGKDYFFVSRETFEEMIKSGKLLEYATVYDNYYGTPRGYVLEQINAGNDILLEIEMDGAQQVREKFRDGVFVFILPPSLDELAIRLNKRGKDCQEAIDARLDSAVGEIAQAVKYDYVVVNNDVKDAVSKIKSIMTAEKAKISRNEKTIENVRYGYPER